MIVKTLDKIKMTVIQTAKNGVVNSDTIFTFQQSANIVYGEYTGGKIQKGLLVGQINENVFKFSYCQLQTDGTLDNGASSCELSIDKSGKIRLVENFEWNSRPGEHGVNIFQEI
jgi:hypothetical protein